VSDEFDGSHPVAVDGHCLALLEGDREQFRLGAPRRTGPVVDLLAGDVGWVLEFGALD
jgi:hypothetical protein